jgi:hypothetical protein
MADGLFYVDSRAPHQNADIAAVTIIATNKALVPLGNLPVLGSNYWWVGKAVRIRAAGRWNTAATPGTQTFALLWGTGADANGTAIITSQVITPIASLVNTFWMFDAVVRCRILGGSGVGALIGMGTFKYLNSLTLTTALVEFPIPATAPANVLVDLTASSVLSLQALAVTSTTNTMQVHDFLFEALN